MYTKYYLVQTNKKFNNRNFKISIDFSVILSIINSVRNTHQQTERGINYDVF